MPTVRVLLPEELHKDLKHRAIDEGIPLKNLIEKALQEYIGDHPPMQHRTLFDQATQGQHKE